MLERVLEVLLAEGELADSPDLDSRLEGLLDLGVKGTGLEGNDLGGGIGVVGNGRTALGAEDTVDGISGAALAGPGLGGTVDGQISLLDDGDQSCLSQRSFNWIQQSQQFGGRRTIPVSERVKLILTVGRA